jgi:hypothetical protein
MKSKVLLTLWANILISSMMLLLFINTNPTVDAKTDQLTVTYSFNGTQYFCGDNGQISLTITNADTSHQLKIVKAGIHFDWMQTNYYYFDNNSGNPVMLASGQSTNAFTPSFTIPTCTTISDHSWSLHIDYQEGGLWWSDETWDSATSTDFKIVDYSISVFPTSTTITQGSKATFTVTVTGQNGFSKSVRLSTTGVPSGASSSFSSQTISGSGTSTMTIEASSSAQTGSSSVIIAGTCGLLAHSKTTMTSITVNSGGILGSGSTAGISNGLVMILGIIIIVVIIGAVLGIIIMKRRKKPIVQQVYQQPQAQYPPPPPPQQPQYQPPSQYYSPPPPPSQYPPQPPQYPQQPPQYPPQK